MVDPRPRRPEIETVADLDAVLASGRSLRGLRLQDLDLSAAADRLLARADLEGLVVLGGRLPARLDAHLRAHRALVFPAVPDAPVDPYRATLYQPHELYAGLEEAGYDATPDARAYHWATHASGRHDVFAMLLRAIHDDSMSDALTDVIGEQPVVGVMGAHALDRGSSGYAAAAQLGATLAQAGLVVATGGGPGAMEAANLGAFAGHPDRLGAAIERLAGVPTFRPSIEAWAQVALTVHDELVAGGRPQPVASIGIPTWFYGHEPPNVFCDGIAKYFSNAIREDGLLARATAGTVVLEGAAGTVQEVFQAMTPRYYADGLTPVAPLVLVGREHWGQHLPVWPALAALASDGRQPGRGPVLADAIHLVDTVDEAAAIIVAAHDESQRGPDRARGGAQRGA